MPEDQQRGHQRGGCSGEGGIRGGNAAMKRMIRRVNAAMEGESEGGIQEVVKGGLVGNAAVEVGSEWEM